MVVMQFSQSGRARAKVWVSDVNIITIKEIQCQCILVTQCYLNRIYLNEEPRPIQLLEKNKYLNILLF